MTSPNCTKYKFQGLPMEFNWNMGKLICSHLVWKSFDWAWTAHRTSAIHSLSPLPASESESRKTEKSKAARRSIHYWVTPVLQVTSILTMITLKSTFWKTSHKVKMSNRQLAIEDWREEWGRSLPSIGSFRVQLCPLPCLWRYHRSWWPGQGWGPRPAAGPTQPQAPPRRELSLDEPHSSSSAAGSRHGCLLCPDAGGLLRPHWLPHALHRPLDHCSHNLPDGPASLRSCGWWRWNPLGDCCHVSTLLGGRAIWVPSRGRLPS